MNRSLICLGGLICTFALASCGGESKPPADRTAGEGRTVADADSGASPSTTTSSTSSEAPNSTPVAVSPVAGEGQAAGQDPAAGQTTEGQIPSMPEEPEVVSGIVRPWDSLPLMFPGSGWSDSAGDDASGGECLESSDFVITPLAGGSRTRFTILEVRDLRGLDVALGVSPFQSFNMANSGSPAAFAEDAQIDGYTVTVLLRATVKTSIGTVSAPRLKAYWLELLQRDRAEFRDVCGDGFISGSVIGRDLVAILKFYASSQGEREKIRGSLQGNTGFFMTPEGFRKALDRIIQQNPRNGIIPIISGNGGTFRVPGDGTVTDWMVEFTIRDAGDPKKDALLLAVISDYRSLPGLPAGVSFLDPKPREEAILRLAEKHFEMHRLQGALRYVLDHSSQFERYNESDLRAAFSRVEHHDGDFGMALTQCGTYGNCAFSPDLDVPAVTLPAQRP